MGINCVERVSATLELLLRQNLQPAHNSSPLFPEPLRMGLLLFSRMAGILLPLDCVTEYAEAYACLPGGEGEREDPPLGPQLKIPTS